MGIFHSSIKFVRLYKVKSDALCLEFSWIIWPFNKGDCYDQSKFIRKSHPTQQQNNRFFKLNFEEESKSMLCPTYHLKKLKNQHNNSS